MYFLYYLLKQSYFMRIYLLLHSNFLSSIKHINQLFVLFKYINFSKNLNSSIIIKKLIIIIIIIIKYVSESKTIYL